MIDRPEGMDTAILYDHGEEAGIEWVTLQPTAVPLPLICGYCKLPQAHPYRGYAHETDPPLDQIPVHGGITYTDGTWVGFDTGHPGDLWDGLEVHHPDPDTAAVIGIAHNLSFALGMISDTVINWTPALVADETRRLARHLATIA